MVSLTDGDATKPCNVGEPSTGARDATGATKPTVCIVGAGAAGLAAADALARGGWDVTVLEARARIGGRCAHAVLAGADVDLGAEFSHGGGEALALCVDAGVEARALYCWDEDAPEPMRTRMWVDGALVSERDGHPVSVACRQLYEELMADDRWSGAKPANDVSFAALCRQRGLPANVAGALHAMHGAEYATSLDDLGVLEWRRREELLGARDCSTDFSILGRYTHALGWLASRAVAAGARICLSHPVGRVIACEREGHALVDGVRFERAIVTAPLGVLQRGRLRLEGVSGAFVEAVASVRFHAASKVVVAIAPAEWERHVPGGGVAAPMVLSASDDDFARQIWTRRCEASGVVLVTGFLAGPRDSAVAEALTADEAALRLMAQLARILGCAAVAFLDALKADWGKDEWACGAYSSPTVGAYGAWRALQQTGSRMLLYAGEAASERGSTVDSALESGRRAARELLTHHDSNGRLPPRLVVID